MSAELLRLAERCENLTGPNYQIEREIAVALGMASPIEGTPTFGWSRNWTSSLDAAMSLVPDKHGWYVRENCTSDGDEIYCNAQVWPYAHPRDDEAPRYWANTGKGLPALALTAAALRAIASISEVTNA